MREEGLPSDLRHPLPGGSIQVEKFQPSGAEVNAFVLIAGPIFCGASFGGRNPLLKAASRSRRTRSASRGRLVIEENLVGQDLHVFRNSGGAAKSVQNNTVGQIIQCKENSSPFVGGPNTAPKKDGQCY